MDLNYILILMPIILTIGGIIYGVTQYDNFLILLSFGLIFCIIVASFLKSIMPRYGIFLRPTNNPCQCTFSHSNCPNQISVGMPSEHAMTMTFFVTMIYLKNKTIDRRVIFAFIIALLVIGERYFTKCHTLLQLFIGALVGFTLAIIYNNLIQS